MQSFVFTVTASGTLLLGACASTPVRDRKKGALSNTSRLRQPISRGGQSRGCNAVAKEMTIGTAVAERVFDPRSTAARAEAGLQLDSPIPPLVRRAIRLTARDELAFSMACRLFVEDMSDLCPEDGEPAARLEHAVARATLDAWRRGQGSCEGVGSAYAAVGDALTRARG